MALTTIYSVEFGQTVRQDLKCHICRKDFSKGEWKAKVDLGRTTRYNHIWYYQMCFHCLKKKIHDLRVQVKELEKMVKQKEIDIKLNNEMEERKKWL